MPSPSSSQKLLPFRCFLLCFVSAVLSTVLGCGSGGGGAQKVVSALAPAITAQPTSQNTRVGQAATFTVAAGGTTPLYYQWSKNGTAIAGATTASYTTPLAVPSDSGAVFSVTVKNAIGSAISNPATLNVGPRAPKDGDWRFQGVDLPASPSFQLSNLTGTMKAWYTSAIGSPVEIGAVAGACYPGVAYDCAWFYAVSKLPNGVSGLSSYYQSDLFSNLEADLDTLKTPNLIITSIDLQSANQIFADSWLQLPSTGFDLQREWIDPAQMQAVASQLGSESRVITALSFDAGQVYILSYGWQNDTTTLYDVKVLTASASDIWSQASSLAQSGYIITAMGGDPTDGIVLVGTRVQGDSMSRPFQYWTSSGGQGQIDQSVYGLSRLIFMQSEGDSFSEQ